MKEGCEALHVLSAVREYSNGHYESAQRYAEAATSAHASTIYALYEQVMLNHVQLHEAKAASPGRVHTQ